MITTTTLPNNALSRWPTLAVPLLARWTALLSGKTGSTTRHQTQESAADLYARAAHYESTQPSFAADLRAAAEAMDRVAARRAR